MWKNSNFHTNIFIICSTSILWMYWVLCKRQKKELQMERVSANCEWRESAEKILAKHNSSRWRDNLCTTSQHLITPKQNRIVFFLISQFLLCQDLLHSWPLTEAKHLWVSFVVCQSKFVSPLKKLINSNNNNNKILYLFLANKMHLSWQLIFVCGCLSSLNGKSSFIEFYQFWHFWWCLYYYIWFDKNLFPFNTDGISSISKAYIPHFYFYWSDKSAWIFFEKKCLLT